MPHRRGQGDRNRDRIWDIRRERGYWDREGDIGTGLGYGDREEATGTDMRITGQR
jgi:hypothetical protein